MENTISPSGDPWFDNPDNIAEVLKGIAQYRRGEVKSLSLEELKEFLGI